MYTRQETLLPSAARTADVTLGPLNSDGHRGLYLVLDLTTRAGTETISVVIRLFDRVSNKHIALHAPLVTAAAGTYIILLHPDSAAAVTGVNTVINAPLPPSISILLDHSAAGSHTYSLSAHWLA